MFRTKNISLVSTLVSVVFLFGCHELYNPERIDGEKDIPVIEGYLNDNNEPPTVKLSWATSFKDDINNRPITGALVTINDDIGNQELLSEINEGYYVGSLSKIIGTVGRTYTLHVELPDGRILESNPTMLKKTGNVSSVRAQVGTKTYNTVVADGETMDTKFEGLYIYGNIIDSTSVTTFYRQDVSVVVQTSYSGTVGADPPKYYGWITWKYNDVPNVVSTYDLNGIKVSYNNLLCFIPYHTSEAPATATTTPKMAFLYVVQLVVYGIDEPTYNFYKTAAQQLQATNKIFDPIPSQLIGNMYCYNDSSELVIGLFEVASKIKVNNAFAWKPGGNAKTYYDAKKYDNIEKLQNYEPTAESGDYEMNSQPYFFITEMDMKPPK